MIKDVKSTVKNAMIYGLGNLSSKLVGFILLPIYSLHFSIAEYGIISLLEVTSQVFISVFGLALYQALFRWYYDKENLERQKSIFFTCWAFLLAFEIFVYLGITFFSDFFSLHILNSTKYVYVLNLMFVSAALEIIYQIPSSLIRLQERAVLFTSANLIRLAFSLTFTVLFIEYYNGGIESIYEATIIAQIAYALYLSKYIYINSHFKIEFRILKDMLKYSFPLVFAAISGVFLSIADRYTLKFFGSGLGDVGLYSLGLKMANTVNVFIVQSVNLAWIPLIFKKMNDPNCKRFYAKVMTYYIFGLMFFIMGITFFGKEVIKIAAPNPTYWNSYQVIPFIALGIIFGVLKDTSMTGLLVTKRTKDIAGIITLISATNILLNVLFISLFQTIGAALATLISQIIYFIFVYKMAQRRYEIPYEIGKISKMIALGIGLFFVASLTNGMNLFFRLSLKSLVIASFPFLLYFLKFYEESELLAIKNGWEKWKAPKRWKDNFKELKF